MTKRAFAIRHVAFEDLGTIAALVEARGYQTIYLDAGVADLSKVELRQDDLLVVLGGPIGAYEDERYPFLSGEIALIEQALQRSRVLGICLGAQLLARALGARVYPGIRKEIGIAPVELTPEGRSGCLGRLAPDHRVLHWHGDTFDLPQGAVRLASTTITPNQAFAFGKKALGLQFHIEVEPACLERWLIANTCELGIAGIDVRVLREELRTHLPGIADKGMAAIAAWLDE